MPMGAKYFNKDIPPACASCRRGRRCPGTDRVLCSLRGVMEPADACRKYRYDPLKRVPKRPRKLPVYKPEDFAL